MQEMGDLITHRQMACQADCNETWHPRNRAVPERRHQEVDKVAQVAEFPTSVSVLFYKKLVVPLSYAMVGLSLTFLPLYTQRSWLKKCF